MFAVIMKIPSYSMVGDLFVCFYGFIAISAGFFLMYSGGVYNFIVNIRGTYNVTDWVTFSAENKMTDSVG